MGATRIMFDALDIILALMPYATARHVEINRLHQWLLEHELTALITAKQGGEDTSSAGQPFGFMQFMVDCSVVLNHRVDLGVSQRNLRVQSIGDRASTRMSRRSLSARTDSTSLWPEHSAARTPK
jgi:circadian clock protein KaiC